VEDQQKSSLTGIAAGLSRLPAEKRRAALEVSAALAGVSLKASREFVAAVPAAGDILSARGTVEAGIIRYPQHPGFRALAQELSRGGGVAAASAAIEMRR
jgi:hypothetical protein